MKRSSCVQPISCDEAFVDITGLGSPDRIVAELRAEIEGATGITASAGIGPNMLLARLATKRAKPNGQFNINASQVRPHGMNRPEAEQSHAPAGITASAGAEPSMLLACLTTDLWRMQNTYQWAPGGQGLRGGAAQAWCCCRRMRSC